MCASGTENEEKKEQTPLLYYILEELEHSFAKSPLNYSAVRIAKTVFAQPAITRKELTAQLKIRPGTVTKLTAKLLADGVLRESRPENFSERGRPEIPLYFTGDKWVAIAVSCDSKEINAMLINCADEVLDSYSIAIPSDIEAVAFENHLLHMVRSLVAKKLEKTSLLLGVSVSIPGIVDSVKKELIFTPRWANIRNFSFLPVQRKVEIPFTVRRQLDVQLNYELAVKPELRKGNVLLFHWGYGIGAAFASQGQIVTSKSGVFCQIGHIPVHPESTKICLCGKKGCLETAAAYWALQENIEKLTGYAEYKNEVSAATYFKMQNLCKLDFFTAAQTDIAMALANLQAILVPETVLLYGVFFENSDVQTALITQVRELTSSYLLGQTAFKYITASHSWNARAVTYYDFYQILKEYFSQQFTLL